MQPSTATTTRAAIHVLAGTFDATRTALRTAIPLARGSRSRLVVFVPTSVHHLTEPIDVLMHRYGDLVRELGGDAQLRLCLSRPEGVVSQLLPPGSTIVVAGRARGLWPTQEARLVRTMARLGHHVVFVPLREDNSNPRPSQTGPASA